MCSHPDLPVWGEVCVMNTKSWSPSAKPWNQSGRGGNNNVCRCSFRFGGAEEPLLSSFGSFLWSLQLGGDAASHPGKWFSSSSPRSTSAARHWKPAHISTFRPALWGNHTFFQSSCDRWELVMAVIYVQLSPIRCLIFIARVRPVMDDCCSLSRASASEETDASCKHKKHRWIWNHRLSS